MHRNRTLVDPQRLETGLAPLDAFDGGAGPPVSAVAPVRVPSARRRRAAFTMIELLVVITIMMILMGMFAVAVTRARREARLIQAQSGVRELVDAWRAYWTVYGRWPGNVDGQANIPADYEHLRPLLGVVSGDNPRGLVFLELDIGPEFDRDAFLDPWHNPYRMRFFREPVEDKQWVHVAITFPNRDRYKE